jgi:hypothetical protein
VKTFGSDDFRYRQHRDYRVDRMTNLRVNATGSIVLFGDFHQEQHFTVWLLLTNALFDDSNSPPHRQWPTDRRLLLEDMIIVSKHFLDLDHHRPRQFLLSPLSPTLSHDDSRSPTRTLNDHDRRRRTEDNWVDRFWHRYRSYPSIHLCVFRSWIVDRTDFFRRCHCNNCCNHYYMATV